MTIIFQHDLAHTCRPTLLRAMMSVKEGILYGSVVECACHVTWVLYPSRPILRRCVEMPGKQGWWVRETLVQAGRRLRMLEKLNDTVAGIDAIEKFLRSNA